MANVDLTKYGITGTTEVVYNPSYELLFEEETKPALRVTRLVRRQSLVQLTLRQVSTLDVLLKINISLWTRILRTQYGGIHLSIQTTTIQ